MKGFLKVFFTIIASILLFISTIGIITKATFLNENYVLNKLDNNNFYITITNEIRTTAKNELHNSNDLKIINHLIDNMVDFAIQEEPIKKEINLVIHQLYNNEVIEISGEYFSEDYTNRIKEFLGGVNINIPGTNLEKSFNFVFDKALQKMEIDQYTNKLSSYFNILNNCLNIIIIVTLFLSLFIITLLLILSKKKKIVLIILTIVYGLLLLITGLGINIAMNYVSLVELKQFRGIVVDIKDSIVNIFYYIGAISVFISLLLVAIRRNKVKIVKEK